MKCAHCKENGQIIKATHNLLQSYMVEHQKEHTAQERRITKVEVKSGIFATLAAFAGGFIGWWRGN